jgi:hypothetical protein
MSITVNDRVKIKGSGTFNGHVGTVANTFKGGFGVKLDAYPYDGAYLFADFQIEVLPAQSNATASVATTTAPQSTSSGAHCRKCNEYNNYANPESDGKYMCYGCCH